MAEKPAFRTAWRKARTCLVPALGWYEWQARQDGKQPYFIRTRNGEPLVMAGLWDCWRRGAEALYSCAILTQPAEGALSAVHPRMPVMVERRYALHWLADGRNRLNLLRRQQHTDRLDCYPVSRAVNRAASDGAELIMPTDPTDPAEPAGQRGI